MKKIIRLTEEDLHKIVIKSVNRILKETKIVNMHSGNEYDENNLFHPEWTDEDWEKYNKEIDDSITDEDLMVLARVMKRLGINPSDDEDIM